MNSKALHREYKTIQEMITLACNKWHATPSRKLCPSCTELLAYVRTRLDKCPYLVQKPTCARCPIHCYKTVMREKIRDVMRYSGPRMLWRHPFLVIHHGIAVWKSKKIIRV